MLELMSETTKKHTEKQLQEIGQAIVDFQDLGYLNKKRAFKYSFLKGLAAGFGAFLGGTIVIAILLWFLSLFDQVPFLAPIIDGLNKSLTN